VALLRRRLMELISLVQEVERNVESVRAAKVTVNFILASVAGPGCLSRIQCQKDSGSRIRIRIKEFKYFNLKTVSKSLGKYDPGCSLFSIQKVFLNSSEI
jgi:hypothetical protein